MTYFSDFSLADHDRYDWQDTGEPQMVERCGCTPQLDPIPFDADGDGIGEQCRRCGKYIDLVPVS